MRIELQADRENEQQIQKPVSKRNRLQDTQGNGSSLNLDLSLHIAQDMKSKHVPEIGKIVIDRWLFINGHDQIPKRGKISS